MWNCDSGSSSLPFPGQGGSPVVHYGARMIHSSPYSVFPLHSSPRPCIVVTLCDVPSITSGSSLAVVCLTMQERRGIFNQPLYSLLSQLESVRNFLLKLFFKGKCIFCKINIFSFFFLPKTFLQSTWSISIWVGSTWIETFQFVELNQNISSPFVFQLWVPWCLMRVVVRVLPARILWAGLLGQTISPLIYHGLPCDWTA